MKLATIPEKNIGFILTIVFLTNLTCLCHLLLELSVSVISLT